VVAAYAVSHGWRSGNPCGAGDGCVDASGIVRTELHRALLPRHRRGARRRGRRRLVSGCADSSAQVADSSAQVLVAELQQAILDFSEHPTGDGVVIVAVRVSPVAHPPA